LDREKNQEPQHRRKSQLLVSALSAEQRGQYTVALGSLIEKVLLRNQSDHLRQSVCKDLVETIPVHLNGTLVVPFFSSFWFSDKLKLQASADSCTDLHLIGYSCVFTFPKAACLNQKY
jgi:hypothetical protein